MERKYRGQIPDPNVPTQREVEDGIDSPSDLKALTLPVRHEIDLLLTPEEAEAIRSCVMENIPPQVAAQMLGMLSGKSVTDEDVQELLTSAIEKLRKSAVLAGLKY